jgi:hypothetical protein
MTMKKSSPVTSHRRFKEARHPKMLRLNGSEHWQKTLDRIIWMLLRAGIDARAITTRTKDSLQRHHGTRALRLPPPEVLEYGRVLTFWRTEPEFLDGERVPQSLPLKGGRVSFRALVRKAVPGCTVEHVLDVLRHHQLISLDRQRRVTLREIAFLPRNAQRAHFVAFTLSALEGIIDTCHRNLTAKDPANNIAHMQRVASAERFDLRYLEDYDRFLRDQATDFLLKQDAWLKRREAKSTSTARGRVAHVGVGIFGFRAR